MRPGKKMRKVCLVTSQNLYGSPRLVKEADALVGAGYEVRVIAGRGCPQKAALDDELVARRPWDVEFVDWSRESNPWLFWKSRLRQHFAHRVLSRFVTRCGIIEMAVGRITKELKQAAQREPADLLIGHNLPALPAVVEAATRLGCPAGFDAEDYHSDMWLYRCGRGRQDDFFRMIERKYMPQCTYLTAASPLIAERYRSELGIDEIGCILNVFPLAQQPRTEPKTNSGPLSLYWFSQTIGKDRGLEVVVDAMGRIPEVPIQLHLRGDWQPGYQAALEARAGRHGLPSDRIIHHLPGPPDEMVRMAGQFHVGLALENAVSINRDICLTNKVFTYMLAGNALVMTGTRAQKRLASEFDGAAFVFDADDAAGLAAQLDSWHRDQDALAAARRKSWDLGHTRYNWDVEQTKFLGRVSDALDGSEGPLSAN